MRTLIIAEAGVNHNGDLDMARQLIDVAAEAGADLVKFQTFSADRLVTRDAGKAEYQKAEWLKGDKVRILVQTGLKPHPDLKDVATMYDLVQSDEVRQVWDLIFTPKLMSRPFVLPPDVPLDRVAALRAAFERLVRDPGYLSEMEKIQYEVGFVSGQEMDGFMKRVCAFPRAVVARMVDAISSRDRTPAR